MNKIKAFGAAVCLLSTSLFSGGLMAQEEVKEPIEPLKGIKAEAAILVDGMRKDTQVIIDKLFSFSELGFQEFETQKYLKGYLESKGFTVETGVSDMPSSWWATWSNGEGPVIALGSDVDGIPKSSQKPGIAWREPLVEGAPGHGEGHNSGQAVNIVAALAVKKIMERDNIKGTLVIWPGIAEELVAAKAYFARDGRFKDVSAAIFTHVSNSMNVAWGAAKGTGLISVEYTFDGVAAHGAGDPWKGRSALDAVELMNVGWNFRREHLHPLQRSHYVIVDGGDQPNVVPSKATVWYFIREITAKNIRENFEKLQRTAEGAALMTDTTLTRRIVGSAWPRHFNKPIAEAMSKNIAAVGMPKWTEDDQKYAVALQTLMDSKKKDGLKTEVDGLIDPPEKPISGGSDDIGDVSWNVPTVTLRFPSNVKGLQGHHWSSAMAMATPIAHKGGTAGSKVVAATVLDMLTVPSLLEGAWTYFKEDQLKDLTYEPFIGPEDRPAAHKNKAIMERFKPALEKIYYDEVKYDSYLEQLGIDYPALKKPQ